MPKHNFEYDFVISYAGEDTAIADQLYNKLKEGNASVFYAPEHSAQTWGANLIEFLADIYSKKGLFCVLLVSEDYVRKQWTRHEWHSAQERALSQLDTAYVLPIRLDDAHLPGLLSTIGYIDLRERGVDEIARIALQKLRLYIENVEIQNPREPKEDKVWEHVPLADQRNRFLRENNYLNRKDSHFSRNNWTSRLFDYYQDKQAEHFFTLVAIPSPNPLHLDIERIIQDFKLEEPSTVFRSQTPAEQPWEWFSLGDMRFRQSGQSEFVRYSDRHDSPSINPMSFIRFEEDGCIEYAYAAGGRTTKLAENTVVYIFNMISILGSTWKFMNLLRFFYGQFRYDAKIQMLVSIVNTENTSLGDFAREENSRTSWPSRYEARDFGSIHFIEDREGVTTEPSLQFVYELNLKSSREWSQTMEDIIEHLSQRLQRAYNYVPKERHLAPQSKEFPWWQFQYNNKI